MDSKSIQLKVADEIKASGPAVEAIIVAKLVEVETTKRVGLIIEGMEALNREKKNLAKINKPDIETFTTPGVKATGAYSKARSEEIQKGEATIKKLEEAIDGALNKNDGESYGKLTEALPKGGGSPKAES